MKKFFLLVFFINTASYLFAQFDDLPAQKFGVRIGANYSLMNFNKAFFPPSPAVKNVWKPGFTVGAFLQLKLNDRLTLRPEYAFTQMNGGDPRINTTYNIDYLSLPLFLKINILDNLAILAGPQFDLLVTGKSKTTDSVNNIEHQTEERGISGVLGVELQVYKSFFVDARYLKGFNHVGIQRSGINEFKWASFSVAVGMHF